MFGCLQIYISDFASKRVRFIFSEDKSGFYGERRALRVHVALPLLTFDFWELREVCLHV